MRFENKVVVVTGATGNLGQAAMRAPSSHKPRTTGSSPRLRRASTYAGVKNGFLGWARATANSTSGAGSRSTRNVAVRTRLRWTWRRARGGWRR